MRQNVAMGATWIAGIALVGITGCEFGPGVLDYSYPVSGDYRVVRSSANDIRVVHISGSLDASSHIPPKVVEIAWNDTFVLAKQQHRTRNYPNKTTVDPYYYGEPIPGQFSYWILNVEKPKLYGPFDEKQFQAKRAEFGISENLHLRNVHDFAP